MTEAPCRCQPILNCSAPTHRSWAAAQVLREPKEVQKERNAEAAAANAARRREQLEKSEEKTKMKVGGVEVGWGAYASTWRVHARGGCRAVILLAMTGSWAGHPVEHAAAAAGQRLHRGARRTIPGCWDL